MNRKEKRQIAKEIYENVKELNNTVSFLYASESFKSSDGVDMGFMFVLDRDTLKVKKEEFAPISVDDFDKLKDNITDWVEIANNYKPIKWSAVIGVPVIEEGNIDVNFLFQSINDPNIKQDFALKGDGLIRDVSNVIMLDLNNGNNSI